LETILQTNHSTGAKTQSSQPITCPVNKI